VCWFEPFRVNSCLLSQEGDQETAAKMQELALAEGALPRHLHTSLFTSSMDNRLLTHRQLSRHLVSLWVTGNPTAVGLLNRVLVKGRCFQSVNLRPLLVVTTLAFSHVQYCRSCRDVCRIFVVVEDFNI